MARGIKNRGTQRHENRREELKEQAVEQEVTEDLDALAERVMRQDMARADAFARAVAGEPRKAAPLGRSR